MDEETSNRPVLTDAGVDRRLVAAVEALLFVAAEPLGMRQLCAALGDDATSGPVRAALEALRVDCVRQGRGVQLVEVAGRWQLRTHVAFAEEVIRLQGGRPVRLSKAALETLATVAYEQPVTRLEIERLRGVDAGGVLKSLLHRQLVRVSGRREEPGRPLEYSTTTSFLSMFSLRDLKDLPSVRELSALDDDPAEEG